MADRAKRWVQADTRAWVAGVLMSISTDDLRKMLRSRDPLLESACYVLDRLTEPVGDDAFLWLNGVRTLKQAEAELARKREGE